MRAPNLALLTMLLAGAVLAGCAARVPLLTGAAASCPAPQPAFAPASVKQ